MLSLYQLRFLSRIIKPLKQTEIPFVLLACANTRIMLTFNITLSSGLNWIFHNAKFFLLRRKSLVFKANASYLVKRRVLSWSLMNK